MKIFDFTNIEIKILISINTIIQNYFDYSQLFTKRRANDNLLFFVHVDAGAIEFHLIILSVYTG